jgi:hypothetical protein
MAPASRFVARRLLRPAASLVALVLLDLCLVRTDAADAATRESLVCSISASPTPLETAKDRLVDSLLRAEMATADERPGDHDHPELSRSVSKGRGFLIATAGERATFPRLSAPHFVQVVLRVWLV